LEEPIREFIVDVIKPAPVLNWEIPDSIREIEEGKSFEILFEEEPITD